MKLQIGLFFHVVLSIALVCPATAQENEPVNLRKSNSTVSELDLLLKKAKEGDSNAQSDIGSMYANGNGVLKDDAKAVELYQKAAEQGDSEAQFSLGYMILVGRGASKDSTKAVEYWKKAAEQGNVKAQGILATMYEYGEIVPKDYTKAVEYWQKAAEQGNAKAQLGLAAMYANGKGVLKDAAKAAEWYLKAAEQGNADAQYDIGYVFWKGIGVPKDSTIAAKWWKKAAEQGKAYAQLGIGTMYSIGEGVPKDSTKAAGWYQKAAEQGNADAQSVLGSAYEEGEGVPKDSATAALWYRKAAAQGNALAQTYLGSMYESGRGVSTDYVLAYAWSNLAAAQGEVTGQQNRNNLEHHLTPEQRAEGQRLASSWKKGDALDGSSSATALGSSTPSKVNTGTAFIVSKSGHAITNYHVIRGCAEVKIAGHDGVVKVVASDSVNDLALLQLSGEVNEIANLNPNIGKLRQGDDILVLGYPLNSVLSSGGNLTPGIISAMTGLGNNRNQIQITAPIQPGSSGSPVLDNKGNVVAVVSMQLNDAIVARFTGSIPQNVNFATNEQTLKSFLDANKVPYKTGSESAKEKHNADIAEEANKWTVLVECWK